MNKPSARWATIHAAPGKKPRPEAPGLRPTPQGRPVEGYWEEWTPPEPEPNMGYDAELHLPAGRYLLNASASVLLEASAAAPAEVECSLFVGETNVSLNRTVLAPGEGESISATSHVDSTAPTVVQWVCGSTSGPFTLSLAVTALKVDLLHHVE